MYPSPTKERKMSYIIQVHCEKCQEEFDKIEIGVGATHPTSYCPACKHIQHPKRKLLRKGWFCRHCHSKQYPINSLDLYRGSLYETRCQCPNNCGSTQSLRQDMHILYAIPNSFISRFIDRSLTRISHYF